MDCVSGVAQEWCSWCDLPPVWGAWPVGWSGESLLVVAGVWWWFGEDPLTWLSRVLEGICEV